MPEPEVVNVTVNGQRLSVPLGTVAASAVAWAGLAGFRAPVRGGPARGPLCGMGVCFECRIMINGQSQVRSCQVICREGMELRTDDLASA